MEELFNEREKPKKQTKKKNNGTPPPETPEVTPTPSPSTPATTATPNTPAASTSSKPSKQIRIKLATPTQKSANSSPSSRPNSARPSPTTPRTSATVVRPSPSQPKDKNDLRRVATQNASTSNGKSSLSPFDRRAANYPTTSRNKPVSILPRPSPQSSLVNNDTSDPYSFVASPPPPPAPPQEFPTASDVGMNSSFEFQPLEPNSMWQKVNATFQFDKKTRSLWHQLHAPYGSYTSFLRHLVLLETHWRNGDVALTPNASPRARQYLGSVRNRIDAYEGVPAVPENTSNVPLILDVRSLATENTGGWNV